MTKGKKQMDGSERGRIEFQLSQSDRTPYDVFEFLHGKGMSEKLHISRIDPKEVVLKPRLVGIEMK